MVVVMILPSFFHLLTKHLGILVPAPLFLNMIPYLYQYFALGYISTEKNTFLVLFWNIYIIFSIKIEIIGAGTAPFNWVTWNNTNI